MNRRLPENVTKAFIFFSIILILILALFIELQFIYGFSRFTENIFYPHVYLIREISYSNTGRIRAARVPPQ